MEKRKKALAVNGAAGLVAADGLTAAQRAAIDRLASGATAVDAAAAAGVGRSTVYRWIKSDPAFAAAYNAWQAEAVETTRARLLALADAAVTTVAAALAKGDAKTALTILQRQGLLTPPTPGPTDPELVARQARHVRAKANEAMMLADEAVPPDLFAPDPVADELPDDPALADLNDLDPNARDLARIDALLPPPPGPRRLLGPG
jgi:hypothetical protein